MKNYVQGHVCMLFFPRWKNNGKFDLTMCFNVCR